MPKVAALLFTSDLSLSTSVREALASVRDLQLEVHEEPAAAAVQLYRPDLALVILHLGRRRSDIEELTRLLAAGGFQCRKVAVIVVSDQPNAELALKLTSEGAGEFLERPLDLHRLAYLADMLTIRARQAERDEGFVDGSADWDQFLNDPDTRMGQLLEKILRIAPQDTTLMLTGETGTGKSYLARLVHQLSPRKTEPFLVVNCGALSANLVESEIFGHVRGAFTGADRDRAGKAAQVGRGTLMLDEIDTLSLEVQAKLLRVVEDRVFEQVGSNKSLALEARLIVATNRNLKDEIARGRFRADLYYRLNVVEFRLPSLRDRVRERAEVLVRLLDYFLATFASKAGRKIRGFTPDALDALCAYSWPGNVREVRNCIERVVALGNGACVTLDDLPAEILETAPEEAAQVAPVAPVAPVRLAPVSADRTLAKAKEEAEMARIVQTLAKHFNNVQNAAAELGISRMTLYNKLRRYGLTRESLAAAAAAR